MCAFGFCVCVCVIGCTIRPRTGALWEHDPCLLPGGGGSAGGVRRDEGLHVRRRAEVEGGPGLQGQCQLLPFTGIQCEMNNYTRTWLLLRLVQQYCFCLTLLNEKVTLTLQIL